MEPTRCPSFGGRRPVFRLLPRNPDQWRCVGDFRPIFTELVTTYFLSNSRPSPVEGSSAFFRRRRTCVSWTKSSVAPPPGVKSTTLSGRPARYGEKNLRSPPGNVACLVNRFRRASALGALPWRGDGASDLRNHISRDRVPPLVGLTVPVFTVVAFLRTGRSISEGALLRRTP